MNHVRGWVSSPMGASSEKSLDITLSSGCRGLTAGFIMGLCLMAALAYVRSLQSAPSRVSFSQPIGLSERSIRSADSETIPASHKKRRRRDTRLHASLPSPPPPSLASIAACVGGLLSLDIMGQGHSVRLGILDPLQPDVFVAGTLNASQEETASGSRAWKRRVRRALDTIAALAPFTAVSVEAQPSIAELAQALQRSGFAAAYSKQNSGAGAGKLRPTDEDPRLWLPTMLSPAHGNPSGNTLRELHYQSRCIRMIEAHEARASSTYQRVLFTRLEMIWLHPHPPLSLLEAGRVWVPAGEDNGGINDRHWLSGRQEAAKLMRRWDALLDGSALQAVHGTKDISGVRPRFLSSEMYTYHHVQFHRLKIGRFPMLSYLACCEDIYRDAQGRLIGSNQSPDAVLSTGDGHESGARTCFQPHCNRKRCPRSPPLHERGDGRRHETKAATCGFKYDDEGSAAIINAELLAMPGAKMAVGEGAPLRIEIQIPWNVAETASAAQLTSQYFCFRCRDEQQLTSSSNLTEGCLFSRGSLQYSTPEARQAIAARHSCRYFDVNVMRALCGSFSRRGDQPDNRGTSYAEQYFPWWCKGLPSSTT